MRNETERLKQGMDGLSSRGWARRGVHRAMDRFRPRYLATIGRQLRSHPAGPFVTADLSERMLSDSATWSTVGLGYSA
jgi:hypothetical protein